MVTPEGQQAVRDMRALGQAERAQAKVWLRNRVNESRRDLGLPEAEPNYAAAIRQIGRSAANAVRQLYTAYAEPLKKIANDETIMRHTIHQARSRHDQVVEQWAQKNLDRILKEKQL